VQNGSVNSLCAKPIFIYTKLKIFSKIKYMIFPEENIFVKYYKNIHKSNCLSIYVYSHDAMM